MAEAYARLGKRDEVFKILGEIRAASAKQYLAPNDVALIYMALGLQDDAFSCLEKAFEQRDASLVMVESRARMRSFALTPAIQKPAATDESQRLATFAPSHDAW